MGWGKGGKGGGKKGGKGGGGGWGGGKGGGGGWDSGGGHKPFWRKFVDASDDPAVIRWCKERVQQFLDSGRPEEEIEWLGNEYRNTMRDLAPTMGVAWVKKGRGVFALVLSSGAHPSEIKKQLVETIAGLCTKNGGRCDTSTVRDSLPQELWTSASVELGVRNVKWLIDACQEEFKAAGLRMNARQSSFWLGEPDPYEDAVWVSFNKKLVSEARKALQDSLKKLRAGTQHERKWAGSDFLSRECSCMGPDELASEQELPGFQRLLPARARLPAFKMAQEICAVVRAEQVTLVLGATGCGKTTQIPQFILEDAAAAGEWCRVLATQPRRISAVSVAERVAAERGGKLGGRVAYKIRFEDNISDETQLIFCTVGILLKVMQSNPQLEGATHVVVDEVHERDLHTDFLLTLLRRVLSEREDIKIVLMSATVDPSTFQAYFPGAKTVEIPGKTNYPIDEYFLEDVLQSLPKRALDEWRRSSFQAKVSQFSQGPLPNLPVEPERVSDALPRLPLQIATDVGAAHQASPEHIDFVLARLVVEMIHASGEDGAVLIFMPGWGEILDMTKQLEGNSEFQVLPLHSRIPTAEQQAIFQPPQRGKRKIIIATILAETSITVEDVVYVVDAGRSKSTFFNKDSMISALRTVWYSKANGFQRRGRAGRCRPGTWFRLYSSLQWEAMDEYELPEMLRSPLEELCLEVASLGLGSPSTFLKEVLSPPPEDVVEHAVRLLYNLGAVVHEDGAELTGLGQKLAKLQVHPMLGKMLLLAGLFRCYEPIMTICASLGYKSPFVCPMGKEKEANAAKAALAENSQSDLIALSNAYEGWLRGKARFANQNFLSHQTMDYIHRLRQDLQNAAKDVLRGEVHEDHEDKLYLNDVCRAVLVAGVFPNLAYVTKFGKGQSLEGLKVKVHPGSVNAKASNVVVAFYEIQETSDRYMYDTTVVSMAPCLLFAPALEELNRTDQRVVFQLSEWQVAVDPKVANELLELRQLLQDFISRSVGQPPTDVHIAATDSLSRIFDQNAGGVLEAGDEEDEDGDGASQQSTPRNGGAAAGAASAGASAAAASSGTAPTAGDFSAGSSVECYWPDNDTWLPATVTGQGPNDSVQITWAEDESSSEVPADYLRWPVASGGQPEKKRSLQANGAQNPKRPRQ